MAAAAVVLATAFAARADTPPDDFFETSVRPLLVAQCAECHGPSGKPKGGLRLVSRASVLKGGDSGPAAVPGKPEESLLLDVVRYVDEPRMPPKGKLRDDEIETLRRWVHLGLPWPEPSPERPASAATDGKPAFTITNEQRWFWSFQPIRRAAPPAVKDAAWPRADLDRFVLAALESKGLRPAPEADRQAFIRRATYDLTGLPPTPEQVEAFVADATPDAYGSLIDRLLASPGYGERWGRHWLDLVRYTDSFDARIAGSNNEMDINESYRYRDWVVDAFNRDLPYDRFVANQVAGDLLPAPEPGDVNAEGTIATGLLAIGNWGGGDADKEKLLTDIADDQVDVVSRAFMGLTVACARCHDHKFDPISTRDYYGLAGIFLSTHILPDVGPKTNGPPMLRIPVETRTEKRARERHAARLAELDAALSSTLKRSKQAFARSLRPETARYILAARELALPSTDRPSRSFESFARARGLRPFALRQWTTALGMWDDAPLLANPVRDVLGRAGVLGWRGSTDTPSVLVNTNPDEVTLLTFKVPGRSVTAHPGPASAVAIAWQSPLSGAVTVEGSLADTDPACGDGVAWRLDLSAPGRRENLALGTIPNGGSQDLLAAPGRPSIGPVRVGEGDQLRLTILPKGDHGCDTTHVRLVVRAVDGPDSWDLAADLVPDPHAGNPHADRLGHRDVWSFAEIAGAGRAPAPAPPFAALAAVVTEPNADRARVARTAESYARGFDRDDETSPFWVRSRGDEAELPASDRAEVARVRAELDGLRKTPPPPVRFANGAQEGGVPGSPHAGVHDVKVHVRGSYSRLGDLVPRHFPVVLAGDSQPPIRSGSGRLELARWLTAPDHPLTARVMVNRIWQQHFGAGIVRTPGNFGALGERPTHPELLDHLARAFIDGGWSIKRMHRAILLSATYRQSCEGDPAAVRADPDNRLFGRMNRRRLDAEAIRDSLLAASGRLDLRAGGPPTRHMNSPRRSLYLMTIRSDRTSFGPLFDAADPTAMVDTRTVSTVAPQALFLLNNPFVLDASAALARRLETEAPGGDGAKLDRVYALLYGRMPTDEERRVAVESLAELARTGGNGSARPSFCHVMLCTNEWIYLD